MNNSICDKSAIRGKTKENNDHLILISSKGCLREQIKTFQFLIGRILNIHAKLLDRTQKRNTKGKSCAESTFFYSLIKVERFYVRQVQEDS